MAIITPEIVRQHNLTDDEYERIRIVLGREPNLTELGVFSVMWSEHCSYKSSRVHLKRLPTTGERVIVPPGENAGVVDIGDGWCIAFKVESHNHPSFIEPFQGAATGVGGILRDVFTMGARPVAAMNSLRFGPITDLPAESDQTSDKNEVQTRIRNRRILKGCVHGIGHYGNCFGVPTIGGEVFFDSSYNLNPLVNAFALGLLKRDQIFFGKAEGIGNPVIYVGAKTGRDGIHGATMASAEFDEAALEKRPTVQVGDPFLEKLLLEACLEAMRSGAIAGIQDMGAAGLTSSSVEMAARAGTGIEIDLSLVPQREAGMTAYEMLLSESQERMLIVARTGREKEVIEIFNRWDLDAVVIGKVIEGNRLRVFHNGNLEADLPVAALTDEAPKYNRPMAPPVRKSSENLPPSDKLTIDISPAEALIRLLASPNICSKHWVYEQYDSMVRTNTAVLPGGDAAVIRIKETRKGIAMCLDGNGKFTAIDPKRGAMLAVAESARNVACVGGRPIAITNCLNFASPERPEVMWSFSEVIDGMAEACAKFGTPIVSGNVSFYNETDGRGILPTPVIGMVGLIEDVKRIITQHFKSEGDLIALLGVTHDDLDASEYSQVIGNRSTEELIEAGKIPVIDLDLELKVQRTLLRLADEMLLKSAHDCSDGGLAITLAECCFSSLHHEPIGAKIEVVSDGLSDEAILFGETPSRIVISFAPENLPQIREVVGDCPFRIIGTVGDDKLEISIDSRPVISEPVVTLENAWECALERAIGA